MSRVVALIDGEHYPPVVRFALDELAQVHEVVGAAFVGGTEKVDLERGLGTYGVPVFMSELPEQAVLQAIEQCRPEALVDLSDEPVLSSADRFRLASVALQRGVGYFGADFRFDAPPPHLITQTPTLSVVGTGKRIGKTAVSAYVARTLKAAGRDVVVLAMGRGGPADPEVIHGERVKLTTADLLALAREGAHASSDNYEDAVMSRVTTVGCRRCGGGMAGETFFSNVPQGARLADTLGKELILLEGSGAAVPPVSADASVLIVPAGRGLGPIRDYFGPYRLSQADLVVIAFAESPVASPAEVAELKDYIRHTHPELPMVATTFRPSPVEPIAGRRVLYATTAPVQVSERLARHLELEAGCEVVAVSPHLSNRALLREDIRRHAGKFDTLVTELKAAAIDVVAAAGEEAGVPTVLCDNVPVALDGQDLCELVSRAAATAIERGASRKAVPDAR